MGDLQLAHPDWSEGDNLPEGWHEVTPTELPELASDETFIENEPIFENGVYTQSFSVRKLTPEEIERQQAPQRLKEKLLGLGLTEHEILMLKLGFYR